MVGGTEQTDYCFPVIKVSISKVFSSGRAKEDLATQNDENCTDNNSSVCCGWLCYVSYQ